MSGLILFTQLDTKGFNCAIGALAFRGVLIVFVRFVALWISDGFELIEVDDEDLSGIEPVIVVGDHAADEIGE